MSRAYFEIEKLSVNREQSQILHEVSIQVHASECVSMIGANGAGKSTLVEAILGIQNQKQGHIFLEQQEITRFAQDEIARAGVSWVPEGRRLFPDMTVEENLSFGQMMMKTKTEKDLGLDEVYQLFPILAERLQQFAGTLSGGEQQMLALARAMISKPSLMLIDEMSIGLSPKYTQDVFNALDRIRSAGVSVLLVEQNANMALKHSDRAYVLEQGRITLSGSSSELLGTQSVRDAYLGI